MKFNIGDKAVVPSHGVGVIKEIQSLSIDGFESSFYIIKILDNGMTYSVPVEKVEAKAIREVMTPEDIKVVFEVLADRTTPPDKQTWNRRYREYTNRIGTGIPSEVAAVLRDLAILKSEKTLSFGERKMYDRAFSLIVQEIAVAEDVTEDAIEKKINTLFDKLAKLAEKEGGGPKGKKKAARPKAEEKEEEKSGE